MPETEDEIIREQAAEIEELQSELVQVYEELHQKQKRKEKHHPIKEILPTDWTLPLPIQLVLWFWSNPDQLSSDITGPTQGDKNQTCWKLAAFLAYFPMGIGLTGFVLGATPVPVNVGLRLILGALFVPVLLISWLVATEVRLSRRERDTIGIFAIFASVVYVFITCIPYIVKGETGFNWGLLFVGLVSVAHVGLVRGISKAIKGPKHQLAFWGFEIAPLITSTVLLLATFFATHQGEKSAYYIDAFILLIAFATPLLSPAAVILISALSTPFSFPMCWKHKREEYHSSFILRIIFQIVILVGWLFLYENLITYSLFGGRMP